MRVTSSSSHPFFQGLNPYTGTPVSRPEPQDSYVAPPPPPPPPPKTDPGSVLDPLASAQEHLRQARSELGEVRAHWNQTDSEVRQAGASVTRAQSDIYAAESDTEESDHSSTGRWANQNLDYVEQSMSRLQWDAKSPGYALTEVKNHLDQAAYHLGQVEAERLPYAGQHRQTVNSLHGYQTQLYRIQSAQSQLETKITSSKSPLQKSRCELGKVAADSPGHNVSWSAKNARYSLTDLQQQLQQVEQHLRYSKADLNQLDSALQSLERDVQATQSDFQTAWHTSDGTI